MTRLESTERCAFWTSTYYPRVRFNDDLTGWILRVDILAYYGGEVSCGSWVLNTTNTGATWSWTTGWAGKLTSFHFADSFTGWAVGTAGLESPVGEEDTTEIWSTTDAGSTWNTQFLAYPGPKLEDICFVDNTNGWAVGDGGTILHTTNGGVTSVEGEQNGVPQQYLLSQNYPNPFNPSTTVRYGLPQRSHVTITVFNALGQQVAILQDGEQEAGYHEVRFDGSSLSSGVYLYRLQAGDFVQSRKLLLLR
jgi:Secretion system C-terminal sorting domain